ncbi:hypothetical protein GCM10012275_52680 [Longimycelium tulufanense]|uniref:DUF5047 domain-containing protein n=1 Tax=Longimycelium tulufanense TaxID=907463 RepID=A0A8J3CJD1_9PSEU|nr:DUF5047 domain-containing protein [Longimycelium tulufanense]GGM75470.1 hypothetical protein GCM10012275_52680 [Longimycelium tulufanense]
MWPLPTRAQQVLVQSHAVTARATAYGPYGTMELPVAGGQVTADARSQVRRTAILETDPRLWPRDPRGVLAPYGTEIQVDYGIVLLGGTVEWVPLIRGRLAESSRQRPVPRSGTLSLELEDRSATVAEDRLTAPTQTLSGALVTDEIRRLIQDSLGASVAVVDQTGSTRVASVMEIERERWADGVEKLADAIGAEVFFDPQGVGVIRPQPTLNDPVVWVISTGETGILVSSTETMTREGVYNGVTASGQRSDGTPPVSATVWDDDPGSPTYYQGPFGRKVRFYSSPQLTTTAHCQTTAAALLARVRGGNAQVTLSEITNPALEPGDVILLRDLQAATVQAHILDRVVTPLSPREAQTLENRSLDLPPEQ